MSSDLSQYRQMVQGVTRWLEERYGDVSTIETHISTVLVTPDLTYKLKKPLDLGFLDFSTLAKRKHCCQEEVRLNRRLAPDIYLRVDSVTGSPENPEIDGDGSPIDYAVVMRTFDADRLLADHPGLISDQLMQQLASQVADFHQVIEVAEPDSHFGSPESVMQPVLENFLQIEQWAGQVDTVPQQLDPIKEWSLQQAKQLHALMESRKADGFIRECHGDLHLGNIALPGEDPLIFDVIEFSPSLRFIDTASEIAFLLMDLDQHGMQVCGQVFLNYYLQQTGDYQLLPLLRFYQVYRAMVRAKVTAIRLAQEASGGEASTALERQLDQYLKLALQYTHTQRPGLVITHGVSGSGKSWYCQRQFAASDAITVRSDIERKRLSGLSALESSDSQIGAGIYTQAFSERTYQRLLDSACFITQAGRIAVVDATFLKRQQRKPFMQFALEAGMPFLILDFDVPEPVLRQRIEERQSRGDDASEADAAVLEKQLQQVEALDPVEQQCSLRITEQNMPDLPPEFLHPL